MNNQTKWQPFIYGLLIASGIAIGIWLKPGTSAQSQFFGKGSKMDEIIHIINEAYVDTVNTTTVEETAINNLLTQLDPHSVYMPLEELQRSNEQLEGEFEGIGVEFSILNDTIMVVTPLNGGPSKELGILSGDRIIRVDGKNVAGIGITNEAVFKKLRGKKSSKVNVTIYRPDTKQRIEYTIVRNKIPIYSVDAHMMINSNTGYIKISRFAATTYEEFINGVKDLQLQHMQQLIVDLRGNPGGYLNAVTRMADEVLNDNKLIVYTEGRNQPREDYKAEKTGLFEQGKLIVLIDEGSASASEIFAGAVQDQDRGLIIGRRSFGKGLVQEPFELSDGSALRLTVARYYTPSGRCIQKSYQDYDAYEHEIFSRFENGELNDSSKYKNKDTTIFHTSGGRIVYGGGGIMPDVFISIDTSYQTQFLTDVLSNNLINQFALSYSDKIRKQLTAFKSASDFNRQFTPDLINEFISYTRSKNIVVNAKEIPASKQYINDHIKALIARQLFRDEGYFTVINSRDIYILKALKCLENYNKLLAKK